MKGQNLGGVTCFGGRIYAGTSYIAFANGCRIYTGRPMRPGYFRKRRRKRMAGK